ncbi:MAG TPA: S9 family peptidase [Mycobacteriales bacterium]
MTEQAASPSRGGTHPSHTAVRPDGSSPATPFHDLDDYVALRRLSGLALSPDGIRLVTTVAERTPDGKRFATALWEVDPGGQRPARRLTRSAPGEAHPAFIPDGRLLFSSRRPDADAKPDEDTEDRATLWLLPEAGEARQVARRGGDIGDVVVARDSGDVAFTASTLPGTATVEDDEKRRQARKDAGVTAILHEGHPVREWDHDLGPAESHVVFSGPVPIGDGRLTAVTDLTPIADGKVREGLALSPDGRTLAVGWRVDEPRAVHHGTLAIFDSVTGEQRLLDADGRWLSDPAFSPDSRALVYLQETLGDWDSPPGRNFRLLDLDTYESRELLPPDTQLWPSSPVFSPDGAFLYFLADEAGHAPVFRLELRTGSIVRLTDSGAYTDLVVSPDGTALYALRSSVDAPPTPVRIDPTREDQRVVTLLGPQDDIAVPGTLTEVTTVAEDGTPLRAWLALPDGASADTPAPLLLWIHGGPVSSWNAWSWRWNPWLMTARGYAVLLPDPALSTGYGVGFLQRGWGAWGGRPFTDLMTVTDATIERPEIDRTRIAAMGGSFGGYMANWIATQTDRFRAIVTHASLWHLDAFAGTTDEPSFWHREFGDPLLKQERYLENTPHLRVENIRTPMLVIHGDKDYRVPIGEALRLWNDLGRFSVPAKFLYFPDENHWILTPGHVKVWYQTVEAFLAEHVLGEPWRRPDLL